MNTTKKSQLTLLLPRLRSAVHNIRLFSDQISKTIIKITAGGNLYSKNYPFSSTSTVVILVSLKKTLLKKIFSKFFYE